MDRNFDIIFESPIKSQAESIFPFYFNATQMTLTTWIKVDNQDTKDDDVIFTLHTSK